MRGYHNTTFVCYYCGKKVCYQYNERSMDFHLVNNDDGRIHKCEGYHD
jgi:hypothetical protein